MNIEGNQLNLAEIKKIQLGALKYVKEICQKNNIDYYLMSGTLLGAVKYKGYIPWDDDIDIALKRKDYLKLIKLINDDNSDDYKILSIYNTKDYYYLFAKLVSKKTKLIENAKEIKEMGVYIDIFPLDYYNDNYEKYINKIKFIKRLATNRYRVINPINKTTNKDNIKVRKSKIKKIILNVIDFISLPLGYNFWAKLYDKLISKNKSGKYITRGGKYKAKFEKELFDESLEYEFEKEMFTSIKNADTLLKAVYGDYTKDLPKEKQRTHHQMKAYWRN